MGRGRVTNARWKWVPDCGGCNKKAMRCKGSVNKRNRQPVSVCRAYRKCGSVIIQKGMKVSRLSGTEYIVGQCRLTRCHRWHDVMEEIVKSCQFYVLLHSNPMKIFKNSILWDSIIGKDSGKCVLDELYNDIILKWQITCHEWLVVTWQVKQRNDSRLQTIKRVRDCKEHSPRKVVVKRYRSAASSFDSTSSVPRMPYWTR